CFFFRLPPPPRSTPFPYTTLFRSHAKLPRRDEPVDPLGVPAQAEEVVGLLHPDEIERRVFHAAPVDDLRLLLELLAAHAVQPLRSEEHTSELQSRFDLVCRLLLEK